ncbi:MAG: DUF262 domain-containing HNH endonuclease family protein [Peptococcaceae bacterium]|nr:DUF262 domain-containing HNH endonuclease family protein [Peptococcaceae bacterium]
MAKNIDAKLKNIQGIFSNSQDSVLGRKGVYIIPDYQRAYNWKFNEQCDKLWQDIEAFIENDRNDAYFFGSIIINNDHEKLFVIDGQQRMTTFLLLLKALLIRINSILQSISDDEDSELIKEALVNRQREIIYCLYSIDEDDVASVIKGSKALSELSLKYMNQSINEEYLQETRIILHGRTLEDIESKVAKIKYKQNDNKYTNFFRNFKFFATKLDSFDSTAINRFAKALLKECQVIIVISYQTEEAIEIFNSLNSTGMPLADADILSAKLYSNYGVDKTGFNSSWGEIIKATNKLGSQKISTIDDILNQYMYILRAKKADRDSSLPGVRRYFTDLNRNPLENPVAFIADVEKIIGFWQDEGSFRELITLKQVLFQHSNNFRFYYATYLFFNNDEPNETKLAFVNALLKLFALLSITEIGYSSAKFRGFLISLNADIGSGVTTDRIVRKIENHIQRAFDKEAIHRVLIESSPDNAVVFLNEYLFAREMGVQIDFDTTKTEIEHIMPASGRNLSSVREDADMTEDEFKQYVNKLGNKILLEGSINAAISNDWFKVKKQKSIHEKSGYKDSLFPIAKSLTSYHKDTWQKEDIDKATSAAAKRITAYIFN